MKEGTGVEVEGSSNPFQRKGGAKATLGPLLSLRDGHRPSLVSDTA